ncbi:LuxR C-terminal-related transcriptional regulator [Microbacterium sp. E-13]|uniref:LuxR C-terminal-related transcriptional regulator n=1 Tax=Microbacterium sp. E-13 TaxID=3404048 RepID=UPI003CF4C40D
MGSSSDRDAGRSAAADLRWAAALELLSRADARGELAASDLDLLGKVTLLRGEPRASVDALTRAYSAHLATADAAGAVGSAGWLALEMIELGDFTNSVAWAARAMRIVNGMPRPGALAGFARLAPAVGQLGSGNPADAAQRFREILAIADAHDDRELAANARLGLGKSLIEIGEIGDGFACFDWCMTAIAAGDITPVVTGTLACAMISDALLAFDLERATAWTAVLDRWCSAQPELITFSGQCQALKAALLLIRGAWGEASTAAELALSRFRAGDYRAVWGAPYQLAELGRLRGAFHSAEESYRRAAESGWEAEPGVSLLHLAAGRTQRAQEEIRRSVAGADPFTRCFLLPALIEIEVAAGDAAAARRGLDELSAGRRAARTPMLDAIVEAAEARVLIAEGQSDAAVTPGRSAVDLWTRLDARYEAARCRVLVGRALHSTGEGAEAAAQFDTARAVFRSLGADPALAELDAVTAGRRSAALTPRELEVLRLVSTGLTNRAVGAKLSLSEKTVARHLANIFGKLGLSTRAAATAYAYENGLV